MPFRDIFVTLAVMVTLPAILVRPYIGILVWSWLAYMNPHRLTWDFARDLPFAQVVAITTIIAFVASSEPKRIPWTRESVTLLLFVLWMFLSTALALYPELAWPQWDKVWKIQLFTFLTMALMYTQKRLHLLVWVIALSLGFYGVKGGIWVLTTGGAHHVLGPLGTFIGQNNEIGLALIMTMPLMRYLQLTASRIWVRHGLTAAMVLTFIAILGTHSRGALVGIAAMLLFLVIKTRKRILPVLVIGALVAMVPSIMPEHWFERMETINPEQLDYSAKERMRAWGNAYDLALERPLTGGGYNSLLVHGRRDAHSIYFEVLGEHGFVGLGLFLLLAWFTWRSGSRIIKQTKRIPELKWASDLAAMIQVSMVGYGSAGAFLGLAYFDLIYHLMAIMVMTKVVVRKELEAREPDAEPTQTLPAPGYASSTEPAGQ